MLDVVLSRYEVGDVLTPTDQDLVDEALDGRPIGFGRVEAFDLGRAIEERLEELDEAFDPVADPVECWM